MLIHSLEADAHNVMATGPIGHGKTYAILISILKNVDCHDQSTQAIVFCVTHDSAWDTYSKLAHLASSLNITTGFVSKDTDMSTHNNFQIIIGTVGELIDKVEKDELFGSLKHVYFDDGDAYMTSHRIKNFVTKMHRSTRAIYVSNMYMYNKKITETMNSFGRPLDKYHLGTEDAHDVNQNIKHMFIKCSRIDMKHSIVAYICQQVENIDGQVIVFCTVSFVLLCIHKL